MDGPIYREYAPRTSLADFVQCLWTFSAPADHTPQRIAPDGRCELIVHLRTPYDEQRQEGGLIQPPVLFAGQLTRPLTLAARADVFVYGVRFRPDGARAFLGFDLDLATDRRVDLAAAHGKPASDLRDRLRAAALAAAGAPAAPLDAIQDYVVQRVVMAGRGVDPVVRDSVESLLRGEEAATPHHLSERQWQRRFKAEVGLSPRMLQTVLRFRRVFDEIEHPQTAGWVEAALKAGYFDQPQMARDFRRFLGCTAREWAAQGSGLAKALTAPETYKTA